MDKKCQQYFAGYARVKLAALDFSYALDCNHRPHSVKIVDELVSIFNLVGCFNDNPKYAVPVICSSQALQTQSLPQSICNSDNPLLHLSKVDCLHGLHRVSAGEIFLESEDQWWTVAVYAGWYRHIPLILTNTPNRPSSPISHSACRKRLQLRGQRIRWRDPSANHSGSKSWISINVPEKEGRKREKRGLLAIAVAEIKTLWS
jgi:hypothetical protein